MDEEDLARWLRSKAMDYSVFEGRAALADAAFICGCG
jgi:hypothetical protein